MLGRTQVHQKRACHQSRCQGKGDGLPIFHKLFYPIDKHMPCERNFILRMQGFLLTFPKPNGNDQNKKHLHIKNSLPSRSIQNQLTNGRGYHWNQNKEGHHKGHDFGHIIAHVGIPNNGNGNRSRRRKPNALKDAAHDHHFQRRCIQANNTCNQKDDKSNINYWLSSKTVGYGSKEELSYPKPQENHGHQ